MTKAIKAMVREKIQEIGFNFDPDKYFEGEEMISISFDEEDSRYFPTYKCTYYSKSQNDGIFNFRVRFSLENQYINYIDTNANIEIVL